MTLRLPVSVCLTVSLVFLAACSGPSSAGPSPMPTSPANQVGSLSGTLTSATSGAPIEGAALRLTVASMIVNSTSGAGGRYTFAEVARGAGTLVVSAQGYQAIERSVTVEATTTLALTLTPVSSTAPR